MVKIKPMTIADIVRGQKNVNLTNLAISRGMNVNSYRLPDGSSAKVLTNSNEIDCVVLKNGKVLTAKGAFVKSEEKLEEIYCDVVQRIFKIIKKS